MEENSAAKASKHLAAAAADVIRDNEDIVSEILLRLPVKSVISSKLVSKEWQSSISSPHFGRKHTHTSLRRNPDFLSPRGLFFHHRGCQYLDYIPIPSSGSRHFPSLSFLESALGSLVSVISSCNGLSLCRFSSKYRFDYCVCNLTTREFRIVPQPPDHNSERLPHTFHLAFNPLESPYYKIVCFQNINQPDVRKLTRTRSEILVYSSENGTWTSKTYLDSDSTVSNVMKPAEYRNGAIFWIRGSQCHYLDLNEEEIKLKNVTPSGENPGDNSRWVQDYKRQPQYLGEWCGYLNAVFINQGSDKEFHVLEFDKFSSEWFLKYTGNISDIISEFTGTTMNETVRHGYDQTAVLTILAMVRGEEEEDSALVLAIPGKVISYNFMSKTVEVVRELPANVCFTYDFRSFPYVETLYPVSR